MNWDKPVVYAVQHKDSDIRSASRSGGIFTALSDAILSVHGVVYGCVLTEDFQAIHYRATTATERNAMRGSKYIQSNMGDIFRAVKLDLEQGHQVLFSGTSCQVAGLKGFLNSEYSNLFCVDIVCHGVPSPMVWKQYLEWQEKKNRSKINKVDFRNKTDFGWRAHVESLFLENGKRVDSRVFTNLFYGHTILRPCCYKCPYKDIMHPGDITIADYWGIEKAAEEFDDDKGVSLVLINNETGATAFEEVKESIKWKETRLEDSMQPPLEAPFEEPVNREKFWNDLYRPGFDKVARRYGDYGIVSTARKLIKKVKRRLFSLGKD